MFLTLWRAKNWSRWSEVGPLWQPSFISARLRLEGDCATTEEDEAVNAAAAPVEKRKSLRFIGKQWPEFAFVTVPGRISLLKPTEQ